MDEALDLYVEEMEDGRWRVYFKTPLQGISTLETFDDRQEAIDFAQDQVDSADYSDCDGVGRVVVVG